MVCDFYACLKEKTTSFAKMLKKIKYCCIFLDYKVYYNAKVCILRNYYK